MAIKSVKFSQLPEDIRLFLKSENFKKESVIIKAKKRRLRWTLNALINFLGPCFLCLFVFFIIAPFKGIFQLRLNLRTLFFYIFIVIAFPLIGFYFTKLLIYNLNHIFRPEGFLLILTPKYFIKKEWSRYYIIPWDKITTFTTSLEYSQYEAVGDSSFVETFPIKKIKEWNIRKVSDLANMLEIHTKSDNLYIEDDYTKSISEILSCIRSYILEKK